MPKRSKNPVPKSQAPGAVVSAEALEFMIGKLGGEKAVNLSFAKLKFAESIAAKMSLTEVISEGRSAGWYGFVKNVPLSELLSLRKASKGNKRGRKPKAETAALRAKIIKVLTQTPQSTKALAEALGEPVRPVQAQLAKLVSEGLAKRLGSKRNATYSL